MTDHVENTPPPPPARIVIRSHAVGYADGTQLPWHAHAWHQLAYASRGALVVETDRGGWIVPPARAVWIPATVRHRLTARGRVQLRTLYISRRLRGASHPLRVVPVSPLLRELILCIVQRGALDARAAPDDRLARVLLDQLHTIDVMPLELRLPTDPVAATFAELLRHDPGADLDSLAARVGASRRTLERRFRDQTGMSLGRWRQRLQLVRAIELIAQGRSVSEVGVAVGYSSTSAFVTAFRRQLGTTPGRYFTPN